MKTFQKLKNNPDLWKRYLVRETVNEAIRSYFKKRGFHEVTTPLLLPTPSSEPYLEVFQTELKNDLGQKWDAYLPTSPEYALKKLLSAGSGSIFEITKSFRNGEGESSRHNSEFSILEWYETPGDYWSVAKDFEELMIGILRSVRLTGPGLVRQDLTLKYLGKEYDLAGPWERISVAEAFQKYAEIGTETMLDEARLKKVGKEKGYSVDESTTWEQIWNQIIANEIEPHLGVSRPTILYDYPVSQAVLSKRAKDPRFAERWEVFLAGLELGNCYTECTDPDEVEERCKDDLAVRAKLGKTKFPYDSDLITAMRMGMPPSGGIAVGIDRLVMLFADAARIQDVLLFPSEELF